MIIDSHAHLNDPTLMSNAKEIVDGFKENGIEKCIIAGFNYESSVLAVEQANKFKQYCLIGTHPADVKELDNTLIEKYRVLAQNSRVVGIGEIGLDYHYMDGEPKEVQMAAFIKQIILADELKLPISLHIRDAYGDALQIMRDYKQYLNSGILLHCYASSAEMVKEFSKFNCFFALGGAITFKNAKKEEVIKAIPLDKLVVETDCPYLAPTPYRGQVNEPKYINLVIDKIAQTLEISRESVIDLTRANTKNLFRRIK